MSDGQSSREANAHLEALGYSGQDFHRSMSLWSNMALGFTYLSPLVGVYSLFAYSLTIGGPPAIWWSTAAPSRPMPRRPMPARQRCRWRCPAMARCACMSLP